MIKNRRDFGGTYAFSSGAIKKKPLQIGVIYRKRKKWQKRGVDGKLQNVPFSSLCLCCVLGSVHFPFFFQRVFFRFSNSDLFFLIIGHSIFFLLSNNTIFFFFSFKVFSFFYQTVAFFFFFLTKSRRLFLYLKIAFLFLFF